MSEAGQLRIDGHKLMFHPHRVARWHDGETVYPLYMEVSPSGACNHHCTFCAKDYLGCQPNFIDVSTMGGFLSKAATFGVASIMYGGEGGRRERSLEFVATRLDVAGCRMNCRMDEINRYLWELTHPLPQVNFI